MAQCTINSSTIQIKNNSNELIFDAGAQMPSVVHTFQGSYVFPTYSIVHAPYYYVGGGLVGVQAFCQMNNQSHLVSNFFEFGNEKRAEFLSGRMRVLPFFKITDPMTTGDSNTQLGLPTAGLSGNWVFGNSVLVRSAIQGDIGVFPFLELIYVGFNFFGLYIHRKAGMVWVNMSGPYSGSTLHRLIGYVHNYTTQGNPATTNLIRGSLTVEYKIFICRDLT